MADVKKIINELYWLTEMINKYIEKDVKLGRETVQTACLDTIHYIIELLLKDDE